MDTVFKIAAIGILIALINTLLEQCGRKEMAMLSTIAGLVAVLVIVAQNIAELFDSIQSLFNI